MTSSRSLTITQMGCLGLAAFALGAGCAGAPASPQLTQATEQFKGDEAQDLKAMQPRLLRQARQYQIRAKLAYEQGDYDQAKYYAYLSTQRYQTARHFVQREQSQRLARTMGEATEGLNDQENQIAMREQESKRYNDLQRNFEQLRGQQTSAAEEATSLAAQARRALLRARTLQAQVIGEQAIKADAGKYAQARLLVETSLDAYEQRLYSDSLKSATQAATLLETVLTLAKKQQEELSAAARAEAAKPPATETSEAQSARQAIDDAVRAQSEALGAGMNAAMPAQYAQAQFLVQSAESRLGQQNFEAATRLATDAQAIFVKGMAQAKPAPNAVTAQTVNPQPIASGAAPAAAQEDPRQVILAIQSAEDARADAVRRGATTAPEIAQGDYALEIARKAQETSSMARAMAQASQAKLLYEQAKVKEAAPVAVAAPVTMRSGTSDKVERMLMDLQIQRAEALGTDIQTRCAGPFKSFEALLELAQKRFDARDMLQALEFTVRASERLKQCPAEAPPAPVSAKEAKATQLAAEKVAKETEAQRQKAAGAIQTAQIAYASVSAKQPGAPELREPATLLANADAWYQKRSWGQSQALAEAALKRLQEIEKAQTEQASVLKLKQEETKSKNALPPAETLVLEKIIDPKAEADLKRQCDQSLLDLNQAQAAKTRAASIKMTPGQAGQFKLNVNLLGRAQQLQEEKRCADTTLMAKQAQSNFEFLVSLVSETPTATPEQSTPNAKVVADAIDTAKKPAAAVAEQTVRDQIKAQPNESKQRAVADASIAKARLWRARVTNQAASAVFQTADDVLARAGVQHRAKRYESAAVLAEQAAGAYSSLSSDATGAAAAEEAKWKPAYAKVIEALGRKDEVMLEIGAQEAKYVERGTQNLKRSRVAWDNKEFFAAGKFADAATKAFDQAYDASKVRKVKERAELANKAKNDKDAAAQLAKEDAQRKAKQEAREKEEAERAARVKAAQEKDSNAKLLVTQQNQAQDALRRAGVSFELCKTRACVGRDETSWIKASKEYEDARSAFTSKQYERAQALASSAKMAFDQTLKKPLPFAIDSSITRVRRVGDTLALTPKVSFKRGGTAPTSDTIKTIDELARVILANPASIVKVTLLGYTDSRGKLETNMKLSKERAESVLQQLVKRGVEASKLQAVGRGPESPVADNRSSKGREANRRVEVKLTTVDNQGGAQ